MVSSSYPRYLLPCLCTHHAALYAIDNSSSSNEFPCLLSIATIPILAATASTYDCHFRLTLAMTICKLLAKLCCEALVLGIAHTVQGDDAEYESEREH